MGGVVVVVDIDDDDTDTPLVLMGQPIPHTVHPTTMMKAVVVRRNMVVVDMHIQNYDDEVVVADSMGDNNGVVVAYNILVVDIPVVGHHNEMVVDWDHIHYY